MSARDDALTRFLADHGTLILDGGLATELEKRGWSLADPLWSAKLLIENPQAIESVHHDYLVAGADCVIAASYQATIEGFMQRGLARDQAEQTLSRSVELARRACERYWKEIGSNTGRPHPLVAASIGPYGAARADGSEFHGHYGVSREVLIDFHRRRLAILADAGADLFACETIPSLCEAEAIATALREFPDVAGWISFTCADDKLVAHGEPLRECAHRLAEESQILAMGVNCTAPKHVASLAREIRAVTSKPIVVYPNSGEEWDSATRGWKGASDIASFVDLAVGWHSLGVAVLGGCCRTGPEHIRELAHRIKSSSCKT
ncbi:MAG: homocysteine S-methyltransferase [Planctomycetota bacterium]